MAGLLDDTSGFGGLLGNPLFNAGLGILAAAGRPGATFGGAVGQGGLLGMQNLQQARQAQALNAYRQSQMQEAQRKAELQRQQQGYIANAIQSLPPDQQALAQAFPQQYAESAFRKPQGPMALSPGSVLVDPANPTQPLFSVPTKPDTELVEIFDKNSPSGTRLVPRSQAVGQFGKPPANQMTLGYDDQGRPVVTMGGKAGSDKPLTESEGAATNYANRMQEAEKRMDAVVGQGYSAGNLTDTMAGKAGTLGNYAVSKQGQLYRQAQEDWVRAKLRKESGATIGDKELDVEISTYFPQPGDGPEVIAQKRQARATAVEGMRIQAGKGTSKIGDPPDASAPKATKKWIIRDGQLVQAE